MRQCILGGPTLGIWPLLARPVGKWPRLVDDATWERVQRRFQQHQHIPNQASGRYLLTGFIRCPRCGARMNGWPHSRGRLPVYRCYGRLRGAQAPDLSCWTTAPCARVDCAVMEQVAAIIEAVTSTDLRLQAALRRAWRQPQQPSSTVEVMRRIRHLDTEAKRDRQRLTDAAVLLVDQTIDKEGYELLRDKARADLDATEVELERLRGIKPERELPPLDVIVRDARDWAAVLSDADVPARREVLAVLIDQVVPVRVRRGQYEARITWTALAQALRQSVAVLNHDPAA